MTTSTASAITAPPPLAAPKLRQRRPMRLFYLGVILLVVCGLAGGWLYSRGGQTISVVTTRATLKPGTPITADQLATVQLPAGTALSLIPAEKLTNVIGKYPTSVVPGGALLTPTMITDNLNPPAGQTLVGVGLKAGQLPARGLLGGDRVRIVITAAPTGGLGTYDFLWTPGGQTTATATGLCPGNYTVLITDQPSGCDTLVPVVITAPLPIIPNLTITDASCSDVCDGTVVCFPQGGTGAYTFLWAPGAIIGQGTPTASNLCPGNYTVLITDAAGCDTLVPFTINAPPAIVPDTSWTDVTCAGLCDGTANAPAVGGTGLLIYVWSPAVAGQGTPFATQLCAGNYSVTISDVNGCDTTVTFTIAEPPPITAVPTITNASCNGTCDGAADVLVSGGT